MEEDLIETADQHQHLAGAIQSLEDHPRGLSPGFEPAMNRRAAGKALAPKRNSNRTMDLGVAEPHAHADGGEHQLFGQRKLDGLIQPVPQLGIFPLGGLSIPAQFRLGWSAAVFGLDGLFHLSRCGRRRSADCIRPAGLAM